MLSMKRKPKTDWTEYGLAPATHADADQVLKLLLDSGATAAVIEIAAKVAVWHLIELPKRTPEFQAKFYES